MEDDQPAAWGGIVPPSLLAVLQQIELILLAGVVNDVSLSSVTHRFHAGDADGISQFYRSLPPQQHFLQRRVVGRAPTLRCIVTPVHEIPLVHYREHSVIRRINIRQAQTVGKLMADSADAAGTSVFPQLTADRIIIHCHTTGHADCRIEIAGIRPDIAFLRLISAQAGSNIDHLIHLAVPVPVIGREVDAFSLGQQLCGLTD